MSQPFNEPTGAAAAAAGAVTLVNGRTFTVARWDGAVVAPSDGIVFEDIRIVSRFRYHVADPLAPHPHRHLRTVVPAPFHAVSVSQPDPQAPAASGEPAEFYVHRQWIGRGARHDVEIHNSGTAEIDRTVTVEIGTDFAHLFDVKAGRPHGDPGALTIEPGGLRLTDRARPDLEVAVRFDPEPDAADPDLGRLTWSVTCAPRDRRIIRISFEPAWDGEPAGILFPVDRPIAAARPAVPAPPSAGVAHVETTDARVAIAFDRALADLASLRIYDPTHPERVVIAAGAPWFMTLFGRDSLLSAWMTLPFEPDLAIGVLTSLAALQGTATNPAIEEEPGKIIHELRRHSASASFDQRGRYYGTVDATPLFVMLAAETWRWGHLGSEALAALWPHVAAAIGWVRAKRGETPSGFVHYERSSEHGLRNQGWKDSGDGITFADGSEPAGPIALVEVQGYAYAALLGAADLAEHHPSPGLDPNALRAEAAALARDFNVAFWDERHSSFALGVTADGRCIDSVTTNPGHALWCGIADPEHAHRYLDRCGGEELFSGWGLRTLATSAVAYNPLSYHNGSVWPHDTALVAAGAARYGRSDLVDVIFDAALDATTHFEGRPPELFAGIARDEVPAPVSYPSSCAPQAWASASTLLNLRSAIGLEPPALADPDRRPRATRARKVPIVVRGVHLGGAVHSVTTPIE